jgi:hypothetical protein
MEHLTEIQIDKNAASIRKQAYLDSKRVFKQPCVHISTKQVKRLLAGRNLRLAPEDPLKPLSPDNCALVSFTHMKDLRIIWTHSPALYAEGLDKGRQDEVSSAI